MTAVRSEEQNERRAEDRTKKNPSPKARPTPHRGGLGVFAGGLLGQIFNVHLPVSS
jgi:hypothetical protein